MASNINIVSKVLLGVGLVLPGALLLPLVDMEAKTLPTVNANLVEGPFVGAEWISVDSGSLPIYADYLPVFRLSFNLDLEPGNTASLLFGLDDPRLMDSNMNIYGLENKPGESYIRLEIETVEVAQSKNSDGTGLAVDSIRLYRVGYHPNDNPNKPVASFSVTNLKHKNDKIEIAENLGHTDVFVNGEKVGYVGINPVGNGGDYLAFPVLAGIGVDIP
ncbi:MAG: hypothetical protein K2H60_11405, partial [Muribaculaceae bacterium]|nr:hypothetical protein [Muribaculaceae bacterium]